MVIFCFFREKHELLVCVRKRGDFNDESV